jgi:hypothetical protein
MVNLAMAEAVAREQHADNLKRAEQAKLVKIATRNRTAKRLPFGGEEKFQVFRLANLILRFGRA